VHSIGRGGGTEFNFGNSKVLQNPHLKASLL
jgi:hypothetical protein